MLAAPGLPGADILREQAGASTASQCPSGYVSIDLTVDRSAARAARGLRRDLVETLTEDLPRVHALSPLRFYGGNGEIDPYYFAAAGRAAYGASALLTEVTAFWIAVPSGVALRVSMVPTTTTARISVYSTKV